MSTRAKRMTARTLLRPWVPVLVLLTMWELTTRLELLNPFLFPSPAKVFADTARAMVVPPLYMEDTLALHIAWSFERAMAGWVLGCMFGILFGVATGWIGGPFARVANSLVEYLRPVPAILLLPILVIFLGLNDWPRILVIAWGCFVIVAINTLYAIRNARSSVLVDALRTFRASTSQLLSKAVIRAALPQIMAGLRQAIGVALILVIASELILSSNGLGWFINASRRSFFPSLMYGGVVIAGLFGVILSAVFRRLEKNILRHYSAREWHARRRRRVARGSVG